MKLTTARCALFLGICLSATLTLPAQNISPQYNPLITTTHSYATLLSLNNALYGPTTGTAAANDCSNTPVTFKGKSVIYVSPQGNDYQNTTASLQAPLQSGTGANNLVAYRQSTNPNGSAGQLVCFVTGTYQPFSITQSGKTFTDVVRFEVVPGNVAKVDLTCNASTNPTVDCPYDFYGIQIVPPERFYNSSNPVTYLNNTTNYVRYVLVSGFYVQGPDELISNRGTDQTNPGNANNFYNSSCIQINGNQGGNNYVANQEADHIYIVANTAVGCPSGGIGAAYADYLTIDGNIVYDNNWYGIYGGSAIAIGDSLDTYPNDPLYKTNSGFTFKNYVVNNTVFNNIQFLEAGSGGGFSPKGSLNDGEGIVIDTNLNTSVNPTLIPAGICPAGSPSYCTAPAYSGWTLISGNQVWGNGSSGIEATYSQNIAITFNTTFNNGVQTLETDRGEITDFDSLNINVSSNILYTSAYDKLYVQGFAYFPAGSESFYETNYPYFGTATYDDNTGLDNLNRGIEYPAAYPPYQSNNSGDKIVFANNAYSVGINPNGGEYATDTDTVYNTGGLALAPTSDPAIQNSTRYLSLPYDILGNPKPSTTQTVAAGAFNVAY